MRKITFAIQSRLHGFPYKSSHAKSLLLMLILINNSCSIKKCICFYFPRNSISLMHPARPSQWSRELERFFLRSLAKRIYQTWLNCKCNLAWLLHVRDLGLESSCHMTSIPDGRLEKQESGIGTGMGTGSGTGTGTGTGNGNGTGTVMWRGTDKRTGTSLPYIILILIQLIQRKRKLVCYHAPP